MRKFWTAVFAILIGAGCLLGTACNPPSESDKVADRHKLAEPDEVKEAEGAGE